MLIYCSNFSLKPRNGLNEVAGHVARWLGKKSGGFVQPEQLLAGMHDRFRDGATVQSVSTGSVDFANDLPFLLSVQLAHSDSAVSGRRWVTEVGIRQNARDQPVECSVLLKTEELSALVASNPVEVTRPKIVGELLSSCFPLPDTPGLSQKNLTLENGKAFAMALEHESRSVPWVVVSSAPEGRYLVDTSWLGKLLIGIADVYVIDHGVDTFQLQEIIGERYAAWRGAVNVISPPRRNPAGVFCSTKRLLPDLLREIASDGRKVANEILSLVVHRTNLPQSWRHISPSVVSQAQLQRRLSASIANAGDSENLKEYIELLETADKELRERDADIRRHQDEIAQLEDDKFRIASSMEMLQLALESRNSNRAAIENDRFRESVVSCCIGKDPTLEQSLVILQELFGERIVVLDTAINSAKSSSDFKHKTRAFELLLKLATDYWDSLVNGGGDAKGKQIFGNDAYSAKEAETLSKAGRDRRTFSHRGSPVLMEKHLKIGIKDSSHETFRAHFEWFPDEKKIVIGYCGKHLNFK